MLMIAHRFGDVEHELQELAEAQGSTIDRCIELVRINEETMDMMRVSSMPSAVLLALVCAHLLTHCFFIV